MKKIPSLVQWLNNGIQQDKCARLRCRCGVHQYHWDWRRLCKVCKVCGKRKGA